MSSDNCIAILQTTDKFKVVGKYTKKNMFGKGITAYRVAHIQAVDNYEWYVENEIHNLGCWFEGLFGKSEIYYAYSDVMKKARELSKEVDYTEYGIVGVNASDYNFPGC